MVQFVRLYIPPAFWRIPIRLPINDLEPSSKDDAYCLRAGGNRGQRIPLDRLRLAW
jgi:hypothetical protein